MTDKELNEHFDVYPPRPSKYLNIGRYTFSFNWARDYWSFTDKDRCEDKFVGFERIRTIENITYWRLIIWRLSLLWCKV